MNTRRYPRTLKEAFGPYTDNRICEPAPTSGRSATIVLAVVYVVAIGAVLLDVFVWRQG